MKVNHALEDHLYYFLALVLIRFVFIKYLIMKKKASSVCCHWNLCILTWSPVPVLSTLYICSLTRFPCYILASGLVLFPSRNNWPFEGRAETVAMVGSLYSWFRLTDTVKNPFYSSVKEGVFSVFIVIINELNWILLWILLWINTSNVISFAKN